MAELWQLTASEALARMRTGKLKSEQYVRACIERFWIRESEVAAWQYFDPEYAIAQAWALDQKSKVRRGLLHGIPVGVKDIADTVDMPTGYGSWVRRTHQPNQDAACVALCRAAGAIILGKTVSTEFAARHPGKTRNPHNPIRTPGGSSSGSAAAVADGMVPLAIGSQTVGSTIRPASYCGVYAYKPSYGLLSLAGVKHLSESFDTLGLFARSLDDLELLRSAELGLHRETPRRALNRPRVGFCRTPYWRRVDDVTRDSLEGVRRKLAVAGAVVAEVELPNGFSDAETIIWDIVHFELARILSDEMSRHADDLSPWMAETLRQGRNMSVKRYLARLKEVDKLRETASAKLRSFDVVLAPSAPGEAPEGISDTGPPTFQAPWQLLNLPAINLPLLRGRTGLPIGIQLIGQFRDDDRLFAAARWVERSLRTRE